MLEMACLILLNNRREIWDQQLHHTFLKSLNSCVEALASQVNNFERPYFLIIWHWWQSFNMDFGGHTNTQYSYCIVNAVNLCGSNYGAHFSGNIAKV